MKRHYYMLYVMVVACVILTNTATQSYAKPKPEVGEIEEISEQKGTSPTKRQELDEATNRMLAAGTKIESATISLNDKSAELQVWIRESQADNGVRTIRNLRDSAYSYIVASRNLLAAHNEALTAIKDVVHSQTEIQIEDSNICKKINANKDAEIAELKNEIEQLKKELKNKHAQPKKSKQ